MWLPLRNGGPKPPQKTQRPSCSTLPSTRPSVAWQCSCHTQRPPVAQSHVPCQGKNIGVRVYRTVPSMLSN